MAIAAAVMTMLACFGEGEKGVIVFAMESCTPCRRLCRSLDDLGINYTKCEDTALARKDFGVDEFPTVVVFFKGKEVSRFVGNKSKPELRALLK